MTVSNASALSHWADGTQHAPLGVRPYWPAARLTGGKKDPAFHTKPELAWELIEEARSAGIPFRVVVADCVYGENPKLEARLWQAGLQYILALRPNRGTWQIVDDPEHPPAFTPAEAAARVPQDQWQRTVRLDSHGKELVRYVAELELGIAYGPTQAVRLIAATADPKTLDADATWYMATNLPASEAAADDVYTTYCLRDWIEHYYKPAKHELGWADFQTRQVEGIVRHWHLVMLAFTFSLLAAMAPESTLEPGATPKKKANETGGVERDVTVRPQLVMPMGAHPPVLARLVDGPTATRTGSPPRPCRPFPTTCCPNLTNQRLKQHVVWPSSVSACVRQIRCSSLPSDSYSTVLMVV